MKEVHFSIQGPVVTTVDTAAKPGAPLAKMPFWKRRFEADNYANIPVLEEVLSLAGAESDKALSIYLLNVTYAQKILKLKHGFTILSLLTQHK
jgi:hypothetical protein